jgi:hypothetical protein
MIEAMKQALEALEQVTKELLAVRDELAERGARPTTNVFHQRLWDSSFSAYTDHAIPAAQSLRQAIAELESQEPVATLEDLEQEIYENTREFVSRRVMEWMLKRYYTTPPQRTWVGLTKDEVDSWNLPDHPTVFEFAQFIEAKLKEKNT